MGDNRFSYKREWSTKNKNSYYLVQRLEWAAMGNLLNTFRFSLGLKPVPALDMDRLYASTYSRRLLMPPFSSVLFNAWHCTS